MHNMGCFSNSLLKKLHHLCLIKLNVHTLVIKKTCPSMATNIFGLFLVCVNPFWFHLSYFTFVSLIGFLALKMSNTRNSRPDDLDIFFTSVSASTVSSMSVVEMEVFSTSQLVIMTILMFIGGEAFVSMLSLILRISKHKSSLDNYKMKHRAIGTLARVIFGYLLVVHFLGSLLVSLYITQTPTARDTLQNKDLNLPTFAVFLIVSTFANCGYVPTNENMIAFRKNPGLLLIVFPQILLGNTLFPCCLRLVIRVLEKIRNPEEYTYMLNNYNKLGFPHLFSTFNTCILATTSLGFLVLQFVLFCAMEWSNVGLQGLNSYEKLVASLFQAMNARYSGESIVDLSTISTSIIVLFVVMISRKGTLDPNLATAEASPKVLKVRKNGGGQFKTVQAAIDSIKTKNTVRTIIDIGPGEYTEKIKVERFKPYITFLGDEKSKPTLVFNGNSAKYGSVDSASVIVESDYFVASNIIFKNTSPRPDGKMKGAQAAAVRISGEKATFYDCRLIGFQDTLCDDLGKHFFKDCYIEGTVDFLWGDARSIYLDCEIHVVPGDPMTIITAQAGKNNQDPGAYVVIHGSVTGSGKTSVLGRTWMPAPKVVYLYTTLSDTVEPVGWSNNNHPETSKMAYFGEYQCKGPGSDTSKRVPFAKKLTAAEAKPFLSLDYIEASKWLLPPPHATLHGSTGPDANGPAADAPGADAAVADAPAT